MASYYTHISYYNINYCNILAIITLVIVTYWVVVRIFLIDTISRYVVSKTELKSWASTLRKTKTQHNCRRPQTPNTKSHRAKVASHVHVRACMHACVYVCMRVCVRARVCACVYVCRIAKGTTQRVPRWGTPSVSGRRSAKS